MLFTSPAAGGKQDGLTASLHKQTYASNDKGKYEHKLTLATNTYKLASADLTSGDFSISNGAVNLDVKVRYSGASTGVGYHLAAVVTSGDRAVYYGQIKNLEAAADKSGDVTFTIPEYKSGEEFYLFVEGRNNNGDNKTDFASKPICLIGPGRKITPLSWTSALSRHPQAVCDDIYRTVRAAVPGAGTLVPYRMPGPLSVEIRYKRMEDAARAALTDRNGHPFAQPDPFTRSGVVDGVSALF